MSELPPIDYRAAVIGLVTVVLGNLLYLTGLPAILDPQMAMDPLYINLGQQPVSEILRYDPAWGPLYALWFKPWVAILGDPIAVYTANLYALSIGVTTVLFLYVLVLTHRVAPAMMVALFFLVSDLNVPLAGKVSAFALLVVLGGLTAAELMPAGVPRMAVAAIGLLLASYVRPELYPAALCVCLAALALATWEARTRGPHLLIWPALGVALVVLFAVGIGSPLFTPSSNEDRLLVAFREHFAWNWMAWHHQPGFYLDIWQREFGASQTFLQAGFHNPTAMARHLADNLLGTATFMIRSAFAHYPLLAPVTWPSLVSAEAVVVSAIVCGSLVLVAIRPTLRREMVQRYGALLSLYVVVSAWSLGSAVVIFPMARYLIVPAALLMVSGILALTLVLRWPSLASWRRAIVAAVLCLMVTPRPFVLPSTYAAVGSPFIGRISVSRPVADTITFVRSLSLSPPVHVLTFTDGLGEMLGPGFQEVKVWQKGDQPLEDYVRDRHVDVIVTMEAGRGSFLVKDPYWERVQTAPDAAGFAALSVPSAGAVRVFVRADRLREGRPATVPPSSGSAASATR